MKGGGVWAILGSRHQPAAECYRGIVDASRGAERHRAARSGTVDRSAACTRLNCLACLTGRG
jgi:hypothetical protein